ncbi:MAG TPA: hypothetical protein VGK74_21760 [Symbiobacteriaceae bacterium]
MKAKLVALLAALLMLVSISSTVSAGAPGKGNGTVDPFALKLTALLGKDGTTDLSATVTPVVSGFTAPDSLKKVQLKSFLLDGELAYTRNFKDVVSPAGKALLRLDDVKRGQPLKVMVGVQNSQTVDEKIITGETKVLLRPDLAVNEVKAASAAKVGELIPVNVVVGEQNGDLSAAASVQIEENGQILDRVPNVQVDAGSTASLAFMLQFAQPGTHTLTVRIGDVNPGDYDLSNNAATFTIDVRTTPTESYYYTSYYWYADDDQNDWYVYHMGESTPFMHTHKQTREDMFSLVLMADKQTNFANQVTLMLTSETGDTKSFTVSGITGPGVYLFNNDNMTGVRVLYYDQDAALYVWTYGGVWTMSQKFLDATGYTYTTSGSTGTILGAKELVKVKLDLTDSNGTRSAGYTLNLNERVYTYDGWYENTYDNTRTNWVIYRHYYGDAQQSGTLAF